MSDRRLVSMSNLINGFEKKVVAKIIDKILSCDKNERRNYLLKLVSFSEQIAGSLFQSIMWSR